MLRLLDRIIDFSSCSLRIKPLLIFQLQIFIRTLFVERLAFKLEIGSRVLGLPTGTEFGCWVVVQLDLVGA